MSKKNSGKYDNPFSATLKGISDLIKKQEKAGELLDTDRLDGKTVMITGASSGLGYATALDLAKRGAHIIMACRSGIPEKGEQIKKLSGSSRIDMIHVDVSDIDSIKELVNQLETKNEKLDILICNAAIVPRISRKTKQDLEEMFVVNYLAKYLLIRSLWEKQLFNLNDSEIPRIIIVSSESHRNPKEYRWDEFGVYQTYGINKTVELYGYYKLLLTTLVNELSRRFNNKSGTKISVFSLCPGPVNSNIAREAPALVQPLLKLVFSIFFKSPRKAAEPVVYLAASKDFNNKQIDYLFMMSRKDMDEKTMDPINGQTLWDLSEKLLSKIGVKFKD